MQADSSFWDSLLFDGIDDVDIEAVNAVFSAVDAVARDRAAGAICPDCGGFSERVHDSYQRKLRDLPLGGQGVVICGSGASSAATRTDSRRTFAEPFAQLTVSHARFTTRCRAALALLAYRSARRADARPPCPGPRPVEQGDGAPCHRPPPD
ncbi:transposase family protein [Streptomyces sp. NBC_00457]|uniref:transposase family protein n=1 Tax=Streptomyces sp. NBC_00457 TaxID=2975748 RepID=UPI002E21EA5A